VAGIDSGGAQVVGASDARQLEDLRRADRAGGLFGLWSLPPASSTVTCTDGSSLRRAASTHPADPAPMMT